MNDFLLLYRLQTPAWQFWLCVTVALVAVLAYVALVCFGPALFDHWLPPDPDDAPREQR